MANIRSCNKHNMIACVEKTAQNADFYQVIDFLTGCSINYSLLVDPDLIGPWLQQFWATATLQLEVLVHRISSLLSPKEYSWEQFGTNRLLPLCEVSQHWTEEEDSTTVLLQFQVTASFHDMLNSQGMLNYKGLSDFHGTEVMRLKRQTLSKLNNYQALSKLKKLSFIVSSSGQHHAFGVENLNLKKQRATRGGKEESVFSKLGGLDAAVTPDVERKSDGTEEVNIEEKEASNVKSGETEELDLETTQSTARQGTITPRILNFEEEAGPSSPLRPIQVMDSEEQLKAAEVLVSISRPRGLSIPGPIQSNSTAIKKKMTLQQIRALETTNDEEVARKIQAEWDAEEERKRFEELKKTKPKTTLRKLFSCQERNQLMSYEKVKDTKNLQKLKYPQMKDLYDKVQHLIKRLLQDFIQWIHEKRKKGKRLKGKEKLKRYNESLEGISQMITELRSFNSRDRRWHHDSHAGSREDYPLSRELDDKDAWNMEWSEDESETSHTLIHLFICGQLQMVTILNNCYASVKLTVLDEVLLVKKLFLKYGGRFDVQKDLGHRYFQRYGKCFKGLSVVNTSQQMDFQFIMDINFSMYQRLIAQERWLLGKGSSNPFYVAEKTCC
ncbi:hypothetical protein Tco_0404393 [Tanacetum coccineum]